MKKFLIIGNMNAITYKEVFPHFKEGNMWLGKSLRGVKCSFVLSDNTLKQINNSVWFTNVPLNKDYHIELTKQYNPDDYPKYDNYDAINCDKVKDIPIDYNGAIGVPITVLNQLWPDGYIHLDNVEYRIEKFRKGDDDKDLSVNNKPKYFRVVIKKKFKIVGEMASTAIDETNYGYPYINGNKKYARVIIERV